MQYTLSISPDIRHCQTPQNPEWRLLWLPRHQNRAPLLRTNVALAPASEEKRSGQVSRTEWCCSWIKLNQIESDWVRLSQIDRHWEEERKNQRTEESFSSLSLQPETVILNHSSGPRQQDCLCYRVQNWQSLEYWNRKSREWSQYMTVCGDTVCGDKNTFTVYLKRPRPFMFV